MQRLDYPPLHQDALPTQNHQRKKERSQFPLPQRQTTQKCTCENCQSYSKRFFDRDIPHILLLVSDFRAIEEERNLKINNSGRNYLIFKILLIAIDGNF